ncbi:MAG: hypothetical protein ACRDLF_04220 [Solirubrobacteraceae bacterium]
MRKHLNYANVVATFALLFAMSGGALAAKHYLLNSVGQINPRVLSKLRMATAGTLWAQISSGGTVVTSSAGVKAARFGVGVYEVDFGREVSGCAVEVTEADLPGMWPGGYIPESAKGSAEAALAKPGGSGVGGVGGPGSPGGGPGTPAYPSGETALVATYGTTPGTPADSAFFIVVAC